MRYPATALLLALAVLALAAPARAAAATSDLDADEVGCVRGTVRAGDGGTLAGATVRLTRLDPRLGALSYSTMRSTASRSDGSFEFKKVARAVYLLDASDSERWLPFPLRIVVGEGEDEVLGLTLALEPAAVISGIVTDENGVPLCGVEVAVGDGGLQAADVDPVAVQDRATGSLVRLTAGLTYPRLPLAAGATDSLGRFRLAPILPTARTQLRVGGLAPFHDTTVLCASAGPGKASFIEIRLARAAAITGRIEDEHGAPVPFARVTVRALEVDPQSRGWVVFTRDAPAYHVAADSTTITVGEEGRFHIEGLAIGRYLVIAEAEGRARTASPVVAVTERGESVDVAIALAPGRELAGRVASADGSDCAGAVIEIVRRSWVAPSMAPFLDAVRAIVEIDGTFRFDGLAAGTVDLRVECAGRQPYLVRGVACGRDDVAIEMQTSGAAAPAPIVMAAPRGRRR